MDGVYETQDAATVDLAIVGAVKNINTSDPCGGEFKTPDITLAVSEANSKALEAWATAPKKGNSTGIDTEKIKVYLRRGPSDNPKIDTLTAIAMGFTLAELFKGGEGGTPLNPVLAGQIAQTVRFIVDRKDVKPRLAQAIGADIDINGSSDKNGAEEFYQLKTFQYPASYYKNQIPVSWKPNVSATLTPTYWGSWNDTGGKIKFEIGEESFCKSSLMIVNTNKDLGYWYNDTVTSLPIVNTDNLQARWEAFANNAKGPLMEFIIGSYNGNVPPNQIWSFASDGAYAKFNANFDRTFYGGLAFHYLLGSSFPNNGAYSLFLPDGVDVEIPVGMGGQVLFETLQPVINNLFDSIGLGAGLQKTEFDNGVNSARVQIPNGIIQKVTNILMDLLKPAGSILEHREEIKGPPIQKYQNNDMSGDDTT